MVILAHNLQTWSCPQRRSQKRQRHGSTLKVDHNSVELPFRHLVLRAKIGRSSGMFPILGLRLPLFTVSQTQSNLGSGWVYITLRRFTLLARPHVA